MRFKSSTARGAENVIHETIDRELFIDINNINDELMDQPLRYRKYTQLKAKAFRNVGALKTKLEQVESEARREFRAALKKATVADIDAQIALDPRVQEIQTQYLDAQEAYDVLEGVVYAFRQRHEAIKELAANLRKEMAD